MVYIKVLQKQKLSRGGFAFDYIWPLFSIVLSAGTPEKMFLSEKGVFQGPSLSLGHFGQQIPESPVFQPQNGVSTSSLSPFIVDFDNIDI